MAWANKGNIKGATGAAGASGALGAPLFNTNTAVAVSNTTTETALATIPIPAGQLASGPVDILIVGNYLCNSGTPTLTLAFKYGSTTMWADATVAHTTSANAHPVVIRARLYPAGSTTAQGVTGVVEMGVIAAATTGLGDLATVPAAATGAYTPFGGTAAENSANALNVVVTAKHSTANAAIVFNMLSATATIPGQGAKGDKGDTGSAPWVSISQAAYNALSPPDTSTLYLITS